MIRIIWDGMPCRLANSCRRFKGYYFLNFQRKIA